MDSRLVCGEKFHENKLFTSFCEQCKVCICEECKQTRHNHHPTVVIDRAAEQHKVDIEEIVQEMKSKIADYTEHVKRTKTSLKRSRERIATARNKVMTSVEELTRLLQEHEKAMIASLDIIEGKEHREHAAQLEHFQISINQLQTHVEWCEDMLLRKKSVEILQTQNALIGRCKGLLNAEKLNIYKPSHVRYEINKEHVENVRRELSVVGRVVIGSTDTLQSVAEGTGLQEGDVGSEATIKVKTKDSDGNQCCDENDQIFLKIQSPSEKELSHTIEHHKDGEYSITYTSDCVGQGEVLIEVNGEPLTGSPWRVQVTPHRYKYLFSFRSFGQRHGKFYWPNSIAIDEKSRKVAVADKRSGQLFSLEGQFLTDIGTELTKPTSVAFTRSSELVVVASKTIFCYDITKNSVKIITNKHLTSPRHLTIARDGRIVVCDGVDDTVKVLSSDGLELLLSNCDPERAIPCYALHHQNMIFVSYSWAHCVLKVFSENGVFLYSIGTLESGDGQLSTPVGLAIDRFNNLVVCDCDKARLQIFTLDGKFVNTIEGQHTQLTTPRSVAVSSTGQLFVTDVNKRCVHVYQ